MGTKPHSLKRLLFRSRLIRVGLVVLIVGMTPLIVTLIIDPEANPPCLGMLGMTGEVAGLFLIARGIWIAVGERQQRARERPQHGEG